jgi:putative hemolysin
MSLALEIAVVVFLIVLNGCFAMSELAIVSSRRGRLAARAAEGGKGAAMALDLADNPGRFLSSVQIGITLIGVLAGAYSGATLAEQLARWIAAEFPPLSAAAGDLAMAVVVGAITYASLIVGELVPKQIALANPEGVAALIARPMAAVAWIAAPLAWVLELSSRLVLSLLRIHKSDEQSVTEEEVKAMIAEGTETGVFKPQEQELMSGVLRFGDRRIRAIMTPRNEVVGVDLTWDAERIARTVRECPHSRFPVFQGDPDAVLGVALVKDLLDGVLDGKGIDVAAVVKPLAVIPDHVPALQVLDLLKRSEIHMALVVDEYGGVEGIVTATDILSSLLGNLAEHGEEYEGAMVRRDDGSWLLDGDVAADLAAERTGCRLLAAADADYTTVAGFLLSRSRSIPATGESFVWDGWRFEVMDMDGHRIDKVLVSRAAEG